MSGADQSRLVAFGTQLTQVHQSLRDWLARLQDGFGDAVDDADLGMHCLAFCSALTRHHTGEDGTAFPALAEAYPDLRPTLEKLQQDHDMISGILLRIETLAKELRLEADPQTVPRARGELDGLAAIMESHFRFEERTIVEALNGMHNEKWRDSPPSFLSDPKSP